MSSLSVISNNVNVFFFLLFWCYMHQPSNPEKGGFFRCLGQWPLTSTHYCLTVVCPSIAASFLFVPYNQTWRNELWVFFPSTPVIVKIDWPRMDGNGSGL